MSDHICLATITSSNSSSRHTSQLWWIKEETSMKRSLLRYILVAKRSITRMQTPSNRMPIKSRPIFPLTASLSLSQSQALQGQALESWLARWRRWRSKMWASLRNSEMKVKRTLNLDSSQLRIRWRSVAISGTQSLVLIPMVPSKSHVATRSSSL